MYKFLWFNVIVINYRILSVVMLPLISVAVTETVHAMRFTVETVEAAVVLPSTRWKIQIENSTYWNSNKQPVSEFGIRMS